MLDLLLLATPIFLAWCLSYGVLEPFSGVDVDVRWNHLLSGINSRRFRPPLCEAVEELSIFEWEWDDIKAQVAHKEEAYACR